MLRMEWFVKHYVKGGRILDVGSCDVNGSYKQLFQGRDIQYIGLDIVTGPNVDIVMDSPYSWDVLKDEEFDYIISGQAFEHIEYPWLTIKEIYKKLKKGGVICIIAPNSLPEHRYPFDCYRYFSDGFAALAKWAGFTVLDVSVAGVPGRDASPEWDGKDNDVCLIAIKGSIDLMQGSAAKFPYERRYDETFNLMLQDDFMYRWINMPDKQETILDFLADYNATTVYIYGYGYLGKLLYKELFKINDLEVIIIDNDKADVQFRRNSLVIVSLLDGSRDLKVYLDKIWGGVPKVYLDDIFILNDLGSFLNINQEIYIYGAGLVGRRFARCLSEYGFKVSGFIVSNGKRRVASQDAIEIYEISELQDNKNIGIIMAVKNEFKNEVINSLNMSGFTNFRSI